MKKPRNKYCLVILTSLLALFSNSATCEIPAKVIAYACYSCHGEEFNQLNFPIPRSEKQIIQALLAFKNNTRDATIMDRITKGYTNTELKLVAKYISKIE